MKYVFLSLLLIASVSLIGFQESFAEIEKGIDYDRELLQTFEDGSQSFKLSIIDYERIEHLGTYKDYVYTDLGSKLEIKTANNKIQLDKSSCSFEFFNKNDNSLFIDSIIPLNSIVDQFSFNEVSQISNATCEAYYDQGNNSLVAKKYASGVGFMEYKYIFTKGNWKTQLEATNLTSLTNRVFGFDQTIDLNRDSIEWGGQYKKPR